ncbi:flagellar motor switch protein FliN [Nocardioides pakistanensis]
MPRAAKKTATAAPAEGLEESARLAAEAIVTLLPATSELVPGAPQPAALVNAAEWGGGACASLGNAKDGSVSVLVGADLVTALEESPMGPLELGAAVQPSLDAAATALGTTAGAGESLDADGVAELLAGASIAVPLVAGDVTAAVLVLTNPAPPPAPEKPAAAPAAATGTTARPGIELLHGVAMDVTVELGRTRLSVRELLALTPGDVIELDRAAGSPADLLVNGRLIARGEVVVVDENFALRITEIVSNSAAS